MQRLRMSEEGMFAVATVLLCEIGGSFLLAPAAIVTLLMVAGRVGEVMVFVGAIIGIAAFGRALLLQRRRYATQSRENRGDDS